MDRTGKPTLITAAFAALLVAGSMLGGDEAATPPTDEAASEAWHAFRSLRAGVATDAARLAAAQRDAEQRVREVAAQLSGIQTQIIRLEALAGRLAAKAELDGAEFDFAEDPAVGGPEEVLPSPLPDIGVTVRAVRAQIDDRWQQLTVLEELLKWRELTAAVRPEGRPVAIGYVSSVFGPRIDPFNGRRAMHKGVDFAARRNTNVVAVAAGIVTWSGPKSGYGNIIEVDHGNDHVTRYAHNARNLVEVGDVVTRGEVIAKLGSTGRATGPNLHFEVLQGGQAVDPLPYIE